MSGVTCTNCNESYNPHCRISGYAIYYSKNPFIASISNHEQKAEENLDFQLYPNPNTGKFRLNFSKEINNEIVCTVIGVNGQTLRTYFFDSSIEAEEQLFDISSLSKGIYFLKCYTEKGINAKKIELK